MIREWQIDSQTVNSPIYLSPEKIARPRFSVPLPPTIELFPATKLFWVVSISCFSWSSISCDDELEFEVSPFILSELPLFEDEELSSEEFEDEELSSEEFEDDLSSSERAVEFNPPKTAIGSELLSDRLLKKSPSVIFEKYPVSLLVISNVSKYLLVRFS